MIDLLQSVHKYLERKKPGFAHVDEEKLQGNLLPRLYVPSLISLLSISELLHSVDPKNRVGGAEDVEEVQQGRSHDIT